MPNANIMATVFIPMTFVLLVIVMTPMMIILMANPRQQQIYKAAKIQNSLIAGRNLVYQDGVILKQAFQVFEDLRNIYTYIILTYQNYQIINKTSIYTPNSTISDINHSIWYSNSTNDYSQLSTGQLTSYSLYQNIQNFIIPTFTQQVNVFLNTSLWTFNSGIVFLFPAANVSQFYNNNIFTQYHNTTLNNFNTYNTNYSTFQDNNSYIVICSVLQNQSQILGTTCFFYNGLNLFTFLPILNNLNTEYLQQVTMMDILYNQSAQPHITMQYFSGNSTFVFNPANQSNGLDQNLTFTWLYNYTYDMFIYFSNDNDAVYQYPFNILTFYNQPVKLYNFIAISKSLSSSINFTFTSDSLLRITLGPISLFLSSCLISWYILTRITNKITNDLQVLQDKATSLLNGDLDIEIPDYTGTEQIESFYKVFNTLNDIFKFGNPKYFQGNNSEKSIKYYKALGVFRKLRNKKSIGCIQENLANLCAQQCEYQKAIEYYKLSLGQIQQQLLGKFVGVKGIRELYISLNNHHKKISKQMRELEIVLVRRYYNLVENMFKYLETIRFTDQLLVQDTIIQIQTLMLVFAMKANQPRECLVSLMTAEIYLSTKNYFKVADRLKIAEELYQIYLTGCNNKIVKNVTIPAHILLQYLNYLKGVYSEYKKEYLQAFDYYEQSLNGDSFYPPTREKSLVAIKRLLISEDLYTFAIKNSLYFSPLGSQPKQYILLADFSKSVQTVYENTPATKKNNIIQQILNVYDNYIQDNDRVSLIKFSSNIEIVFNLTEKGRYNKILRETIDGMKREELHGKTALYSTMKVILNTIRKLKRHKVLVILLDGADNCSSINMKTIKEELSEISEITLLIIGIELQQPTILELEQLVKECKRGYIVDIDDREDVGRILEQKKYVKEYIETYIV